MDHNYTIMDQLPRNEGLTLAEIEAALHRAQRIIETLADEADRDVVSRYIAELECARTRLLPR